jgi:hypothetical protein
MLASCGPDGHSSPGAGTGTINLELVAHTADATYHLRMASFAIVGPTTTTVTTESADSEAASLTVKLAVGHYTVTLADGWALYRGADAATEVRVAASLLSPNPASFDVTASATTFVPFRFATDGLVIATGPTGTVEVSTEVNELHGLALLAGDYMQSGSADGVGAAARFDTPTTLVADGQGNLYINDSHNLTIRKLVVATGEVTTVAGSPGEAGYTDGVGTAARFVFPYGMALDGKGNLYISDQYHLRRLVVATGEVIDLKGITVDSVGTPLSIYGPVAIDNMGAPLVVEAVPAAANVPLRRVDLESGTTSIITTVTSAVDAMTAFQVPAHDLILPYLDIYLAEGALTRIENIRFATDSAGLQVGGAADLFSFAGHDGNPGAADGSGPNAQFLRPIAITNDGAGNLFVADAPNGTIRKVVVETGEVTTVVGKMGVTGPTPGPLPAALGRPVGVAVLPNGALAIADGNAIYIARF